MCHELSHIVFWFRSGEGIGPLTIRRDTDCCFSSSSVLWPRNGDQRRLDLREYAEPLAERVLAGESGSRTAVGMRTDQICSDGILATPSPAFPIF
jgi:hypothetical protein